MNMVTMNEILNNNAFTRKDYQIAAVELLLSEDNKYFLTIAPVHNTNINSLIKTFNKLLRLLNESLYGKKYKKQNKFINGIAVLHNATKHNPHFHVLIRDPNGDLENNRTFDEAVKRSLPKIKSWDLKESKYKGRQLIGSDSYNIQEYYNNGDNQLEYYMTKEMQWAGCSIKDKLNNVSPLNADGALFGGR